MRKRFELINAKRLSDKQTYSTLQVEDGQWQQVTEQPHYLQMKESIPLANWHPARSELNPETLTIDVEGRMVLPGFVDAHMHMDKAFSLYTVPNFSGTLEEAIINYSQAYSQFEKAELIARMKRVALQALSYGTTHIRTHLDLITKPSPQLGRQTLEAALEVKQTLAPYLTIQLYPMAGYEGLTSQELALLDEALQSGVDGVGGAPHLAAMPKPHIDYLFEKAMQYGRPLDLHTDESDDPKRNTVIHIAERTKQYGLAGQVTVDHLCSLASMDNIEAERIINLMHEAGLMAVSLPACNLYLQGRHDHFPVRRGVTRLKEIWQKGIPIAVGSDNIHDPFHPFGRGDLLQIALISSYATHMGGAADLRTLLRMITDVPARILGLSGYGIEEGHDASFVIVDGQSPEDLFTMQPERRWVYNKSQWLRIPAPEAKWEIPALATHWQQAMAHPSFSVRR